MNTLKDIKEQLQDTGSYQNIIHLLQMERDYGGKASKEYPYLENTEIDEAVRILEEFYDTLISTYNLKDTEFNKSMQKHGFENIDKVYSEIGVSIKVLKEQIVKENISPGIPNEETVTTVVAVGDTVSNEEGLTGIVRSIQTDTVTVLVNDTNPYTREWPHSVVNKVEPQPTPQQEASHDRKLMEDMEKQQNQEIEIDLDESVIMSASLDKNNILHAKIEINAKEYNVTEDAQSTQLGAIIEKARIKAALYVADLDFDNSKETTVEDVVTDYTAGYIQCAKDAIAAIGFNIAEA